MKEWLEQVLISKNLNPVPYLKEFNVNKEFQRSIKRDYKTYQEAEEKAILTIVITKNKDMNKIVSFSKPLPKLEEQPLPDIAEQPLPDIDHGKHYRFEYVTPLGEVVKLDPYLVGKAWGMTSAPLQTVLKKIARSGNGGYKDYEQDLNDCICALERELELIGYFKGLGEK